MRCDEPPGLVTENAFAIFYLHWHEEAWRVFVRLRVEIAADGKPQTGVELVTAQKVGVSGVSN